MKSKKNRLKSKRSKKNILKNKRSKTNRYTNRYTNKNKVNKNKVNKPIHKKNKISYMAKLRNLFFKKKLVKGGENAINSDLNPDGSVRPLNETDGDLVEDLFNQTQNDDWKHPLPFTPVPYVSPYEVFNTSSSVIYPMYFGKLPSQLPDSLYVPIYRYYATDASDTALPEPDAHTLGVYNYIVNDLLQNAWSQCVSMGQTCKFTSLGLKTRARRSCCGFIAPVLGIVLHYIDYAYKNDMEVTSTYIDIAIKTGINFYTERTGYGTSPYSWNTNCNIWSKKLEEGTNILTFYQRLPPQQFVLKPDCSTYHHFIVYKIGDYCILIDSWAGMGGHRGEWARIMNTGDVYSLLNQIGSTQYIEETNQLLNEYFIVPHSVDINDNVDLNWQHDLLSVGAYNLIHWNDEIMRLEKISNADILLKYGGSNFTV